MQLIFNIKTSQQLLLYKWCLPNIIYYSLTLLRTNTYQVCISRVGDNLQRKFILTNVKSSPLDQQLLCQQRINAAHEILVVARSSCLCFLAKSDPFVLDRPNVVKCVPFLLDFKHGLAVMETKLVGLLKELVLTLLAHINSAEFDNASVF